MTDAEIRAYSFARLAAHPRARVRYSGQSHMMAVYKFTVTEWRGALEWSYDMGVTWELVAEGRVPADWEPWPALAYGMT